MTTHNPLLKLRGFVGLGSRGMCLWLESPGDHRRLEPPASVVKCPGINAWTLSGSPGVLRKENSPSRIHSTTSLGPLRAPAPHRRKFGGDLSGGDDLIHDPVLHGRLGGKDEVAVGVLRHSFQGLAGVEGDQLLQEPAVPGYLLGLDLDVNGLALCTAVRLVEQDAGVGQGVALALVPASTSTAEAEAA